MERPTIAIVMGTRPEVIKLASVLRALRQTPTAHVIVVNTGQHREMMEQALMTFGITPDVNLELMEAGQNLAEFLTKAIHSLSAVFARVNPGIVVVQGDTTTAMAAALCAFYANVPVCHVEAGLRTFDMHHPFPEEVNRRIITAATRLHCCPTKRARDNLLREGIAPRRIIVTGNTVIDALHLVRDERYVFQTDILNHLDYGQKLIVVTIHRRENHGARLAQICQALRDLAEMDSDLSIVFPVHLNPNVHDVVHQELAGFQNIHLVPPLPYGDQVNLMARSWLVLTDSGGLQEEAPSLGKPVLVLRDKTERPEAIEAGHARLVGAQREKIVRETRRLLTNTAAYRRMAKPSALFGDGRAGEKIVRRILALVEPGLENAVPAFSA